MARRVIHRPVSAGRPLTELESALAEVGRRGDAASVHALRVALARAGVWLRLGHHRALAEDARWLRRAAGPVRDADVQLELKGGPGAAPERLRFRRDRALAALRAVLETERSRALVTSLHALEPLGPRRTERGLRRFVRAALARGAAAERRWEDPERLHALRRSLRRVRYGFECAGLAVGGVARLQTALGEAHDLALALAQGKSAALTRRLAHAEGRAQKLWRAERRRLEKFSQSQK